MEILYVFEYLDLFLISATNWVLSFSFFVWKPNFTTNISMQYLLVSFSALSDIWNIANANILKL